jgi:hypothetical protein
MTSILIDDKKQGAQEMLELLRVLNFVSSYETVSNEDTLEMRKRMLIRHPENYDPLALAGVAQDTPLDLKKIREGWTKKK